MSPCLIDSECDIAFEEVEREKDKRFIFMTERMKSNEQLCVGWITIFNFVLQNFFLITVVTSRSVNWVKVLGSSSGDTSAVELRLLSRYFNLSYIV